MAEEASKAPAEADAAMASSDAKKRSTKRRKKAADATQQDLSPDEIARREKQRIAQELAMKLRQEGKVYKKQRPKGPRDDTSKRSKLAKQPKENKRSKKDKPIRRPAADLDVVIVPIFWNMKIMERDEIFEASHKIEDMIRKAGLRVYVDKDTHRTPGQKMRHWEEKQVKVRIEVGPKEAALGSCILAIANSPGQVANKSTLEVDEQLVAEINRALGDPVGYSSQQEQQQQQEEEEEEEEQQQPAKKAKKEKKSKQQEEQQQEEEQQQQEQQQQVSKKRPKQQADDEQQAQAAPAQPAAAAQKQHVISGDALEDDFDLDFDQVKDEQPAGRNTFKKEKQLRKRKAGGASADPKQDWNSWEDDKPRKGSQQQKVVKF